MKRSVALWLVVLVSAGGVRQSRADDLFNQPGTATRAATTASAPDVVPASLAPAVPDWRQMSQDLRLAAEMGERITMRLADVLQAVMFHASEAARQFDPLGLKAANATIDRQSVVIQELMQAEIDRLKAENKRLRRAANKASRRDQAERNRAPKGRAPRDRTE